MGSNCSKLRKKRSEESTSEESEEKPVAEVELEHRNKGSKKAGDLKPTAEAELDALFQETQSEESTGESEHEPMTEAELDALFEETQHEVGSLLEKLKSRDEYLSQEACDAIDSIKRSCFFLWYDANYQKISSRLVDFMLQHGLAQLIVKIIKSTGKVAVDFRRNAGLVLSHLLVDMEDTNKSAYEKVEVELIKCGIIGALVKELDTYDPNTNDPIQRLLITDILFDLNNMRSAPNVIPIYRAANAVNALMKFAEADDVMTRIDSLKTLAYIINEKESERIAASGECIKTLLDMAQKAAESDEREYRFVINIDGEEKVFFTPLYAALRTISALANNDANKAAIVQHGGLPILTAKLRPEYTDTEKMHAVEALWKLSFLESNKEPILAHLTYTDTVAMEVLQEMKSCDDPYYQNPSQGILFQLGLLDIHKEPPVEQQQQPASPATASASASASPRPRTPPPSYQETMGSSHVMISYNWKHQDRAIRVRDEIKSRGFNIWLDTEHMKGNMLVAMADAVEKAEAILVCVSSTYKTSTNCQQEASYAHDMKKPIIPLIIEEGYKADGWLGFLIAGKKYIKVYTDELLEQGMPDLIRELGNKGRAV